MAKSIKDAPSMESEDRAFFKSAYQNNPTARKEILEYMKKYNLTPEQVFGTKTMPPIRRK